EGIYLAIGFIAVGAGMASTNLFAEIGKEYSGKSRNIESGMTLYYAMTNLGAYIGIFIAVIYADYKTGFCLMAILSAGSLISYVLIPKETVNFGSAVLEEKTKKERPITLSGIGISATIVIGIGAIIYWNCFEYVGGELTLALHTLNNFSGIQDVNISILYTNTNAFVVIISGTILTFLYLNKKFSPFIKAGIGLIMFAIALVCFSFLIQSDVNIFTVIILSQILFSISEILIAPTLLSFYVKKIPKNRLAFAIGIGSVVTMLAMKIVSNMQNYSSEATSNFLLYSVPVIILLVAIGVPFLFFDKLFAEKEPTPEEGSGYDDEFDFNDDIV
ncbi:MAG: dipeptide/tripeptide permease, partial [Patiriisocius sp.]